VFVALSPAKAEEFLKQAQEAKMTNILYVGTKSWNDKDFLNFVKANKKLDTA